MSKAIPDSVTRLIESFARLPGIGPKTASRLTYYLLRAPEELSRGLADAISELKARTRLCSVCFNITEADPCPVCSDPLRESHVVAVVEEPLDALALERTGVYRGRYHVLHGSISPSGGVGPDQLKIRELMVRVAQGGIREVILATNPDLEGDATAMFIQRSLSEGGYLADSTEAGIHVTRLSRGLPTGGELEYVDLITLTRALQGRQEL
jgi:recombination protein RecR